MDHRQRVLLAIHHQQPDRLPLALWGSTHGVTDPLYFRLLKHLGLGEPVPPFRRRLGHSVNYYDDRVLEALDIDVRHVWLGFDDLAGPPAEGGLDAWGVGWQRSGLYASPREHPLATSTSAEEIENYPWPDVERLIRLDELQQRAEYLRRHSDCAIVGRAVDSYGPLERCSQLRGYLQFMKDLALNPDFVHALVDKVTQVLCRLLEIYLDKVGSYLDIIELPGDDYAARTPLISPAMFDRYFAPAWRQMIGLVRQAAPHCKVLFHSDGNMQPFLSRLIALGVDIFHGLEPLPNVEMAQIKDQYGQHLCFWGAIDIKEALQGDLARLEAEVQERIRLLAPGGGYVLAPANHLQPDIPAENVIALFRAARRFGVY
jgi:uroporphyrinogen decarboxylase